MNRRGEMMMKEYIFLCPKCEQEAEHCCASLIRFLHRLDLPYFVCVRCQTAGYDKRLTMSRVTWLRSVDRRAKETPFKFIYRMAKEYLEEIMKHRVDEMGYELVRFRRVEKARK